MQHKPEFAKTQFIASPPLHEAAQMERIAYVRTSGDAPTLIWCGGLMSDMSGTKALAFHNWAADQGLGFVRFDYLGHGESSGEFIQGTISRWAQDTLQVIDELTDGPLILIGSSMGGWVSLLAARARADRVRGLLLINPAPDFTEDVYGGFTSEQRAEIERDGVTYIPSDYDEPYAYSWGLIEDGRANLLLKGDLGLDIPVEVFSGSADEIVPTDHVRRLADKLSRAELSVVEGGDHSLSRPADIHQMCEALRRLTLQV